jgi:putative transposase
MMQPTIDVKSLHAKIGELTPENGFFGGSAHQGAVAERKAVIDRARSADHEAGGGSAYQPRQRHYLPRPVSGADLAIRTC